MVVEKVAAEIVYMEIEAWSAGSHHFRIGYHGNEISSNSSGRSIETRWPLSSGWTADL
jgi:hypothetical protein